MPSRFSQRWTVVTSRFRYPAISFQDSSRSFAAAPSSCFDDPLIALPVRPGGLYRPSAATAKNGIRRYRRIAPDSAPLPFDSRLSHPHRRHVPGVTSTTGQQEANMRRKLTWAMLGAVLIVVPSARPLLATP